ncbi:MAG: oxidoreductase [Alphaproteobacteria bacterium]|nr:oxidoreductase [Alphaproteobacteria bacterium]
MSFNAILLTEAEGKVSSALTSLDEAQLPEGDVLVGIDYTTINYKDGLILNGLGKMVAKYPHIPGIDFSGSVLESATDRYKPGDKVILTGWRVGETHWGGFAQKARVKSDWLVPMPEGLNTRRAMALGTAGFTAMLAVMALEAHGLSPKKEGEVLVTGAAGGVGSVAVAVLANLGYQVAASTGRADQHDYLKSLGAATIVDRKELSEAPKRPMMSERWIGAIDNVGGPTLSTVLASLKHRCSCASVGNAGGIELNATVIPFLLRGINLLGIDSGASPFAERQTAWSRLVREMPMDKLDQMTGIAGLGDLPALANTILKGGIKGRTLIDVNK